MKICIIKSLLTSLYKREEVYPSLTKRGKGSFFIMILFLAYSLIFITHGVADDYLYEKLNSYHFA
jgi:hypothetical protein